jgi:CRP-like cAMP-binding protein
MESMNIATLRIGAISEVSENANAYASRAKSGANRLSLTIRGESLEGASGEPTIVQNLLSRQEEDLLIQGATVLAYRRGQALFSEGQDASFLYFIGDGIIRMSRCAENGHRQILSFRLPGDILGLSESGQYSSSAETVSAAQVYRVPWKRMQQAMLIEPELQLHLFMKVANDYRQAEDRIVILGQQNTCQRLISFILGLLQLPELFDKKQSLLRIPVNRFDLADYLGTVTSSSERSFAKLESLGLIRRVTSRTVQIIDLSGLQRLQCEQRRGHH